MHCETVKKNISCCLDVLWSTERELEGSRPAIPSAKQSQ